MTLAVSAMAEFDQVPKVHRKQRDENGAVTENDLINSNPAVNGPPKKRKRTRKISLDKRFECKHEGCGRSYSRAEHLYRHQLNRMSTGLESPRGNQLFLTQYTCFLFQIPPSRFIDVTSRTAIDLLCGKTFVCGTENDIPPKALNFRSAIILLWGPLTAWVSLWHPRVLLLGIMDRRQTVIIIPQLLLPHPPPT